MKKNTTEFFRKLKTETNKPESASRLQNAAIGMRFLFSSYLFIIFEDVLEMLIFC